MGNESAYSGLFSRRNQYLYDLSPAPQFREPSSFIVRKSRLKFSYESLSCYLRDDATQIHPIFKLDDNLLDNLGKFMQIIRSIWRKLVDGDLKFPARYHPTNLSIHFRFDYRQDPNTQSDS